MLDRDYANALNERAVIRLGYAVALAKGGSAESAKRQLRAAREDAHHGQQLASEDERFAKRLEHDYCSARDGALATLAAIPGIDASSLDADLTSVAHSPERGLSVDTLVP